MSLIQMNHYITKNSDGSVHVQNAVMGHFGQHHVHTEVDFQHWVKKNKIDRANIIIFRTDKDCQCGLQPGEYADGLPEEDGRGTGKREH